MSSSFVISFVVKIVTRTDGFLDSSASNLGCSGDFGGSVMTIKAYFDDDSFLIEHVWPEEPVDRNCEQEAGVALQFARSTLLRR